MKLVNQTPLAARVETSELGGMRIGVLTAKSTHRFDAEGGIALDTQEPIGLFDQDEETPRGVLPADLEPRRDGAFEVLLLGHAHAPGGRAIETLTVALTVGAVRRAIVVTGDRTWGRPPSISRPVPFVRMPLTYAHAFGGRQTARIDAASEFEIRDPVNPHGRGFDAELYAAQLGILLRSPAGYPTLPPDYRRALPNLESPDARVARWEDAPPPICWATTPRDVTVHALRKALAQPANAEQETFSADPEKLPPFDDALYRAHPDWVIATPASAPIVRMENLVDERAVVELRLPDERVVADYVIEGRQGSRPLAPQTLVLLPDERRFCVLYRTAFTFGFVPGDERAFRLRLCPGWYAGQDRPQ